MEFNAEINQWLQRFNSIVNRNKNGRLVCVSHLLYISQRMRKHVVILSSLSVTNAWPWLLYLESLYTAAASVDAKQTALNKAAFSLLEIPGPFKSPGFHPASPRLILSNSSFTSPSFSVQSRALSSEFGETASWKGSSVWAEVVKLDVRCTFSQVAVAWKALGVKPSSTGVNTPSCSIIGPTALSLWCPSPRTLFVLCLPSTQIRERINLPFWLFSICSAFLWIIGSPGRDPWRALCSILGLVAVKPEAAAHSWLSESLKMS